MSVEPCVAPGVLSSPEIHGSPEGSLIVAWQHRGTRLISPVGRLEHPSADGYRFRYLRSATGVQGFQRFLSFPDWEGDYRSPNLFPLFSQRIMSPRRPDYSEFLRQLHLAGDTTPWEQLARSEGRRTGDTVQVFPVPPTATDGVTTCLFLVHGIRHVLPAGLMPLSGGQRLDLADDRDNPVNSEAVCVVGPEGQSVGYVPDLLLEHVRVLQAHGPVGLTVEHVNGPDVPSHLQLLVRMRGSAPPAYRPMSGPRWETFV